MQRLVEASLEGHLVAGEDAHFFPPITNEGSVRLLLAVEDMAKVFDFLDATNDILQKRGITLPLPAQGTTTPEDRAEKGLAGQKQIVGPEVVDALDTSAAKDTQHTQQQRVLPLSRAPSRCQAKCLVPRAVIDLYVAARRPPISALPVEPSSSTASGVPASKQPRSPDGCRDLSMEMGGVDLSEAVRH
jgi:hypothetical protein